MSKPTISPAAHAETERQLAAAQAETGLRDWDSWEFLEPLQVLLDGILHEAQLTPEALAGSLGRVQNLLRNRLRLQHDRSANPGIADEAIVRPLIIMGLPRSGTTHLHSLLAQDPGSRVPLLWEMLMPSPPPQRASHDSDPRIAAVDELLEQRGLMSPKLRAMHPFHARLPEECSNIFEHSFLALNFSATIPLPSYRRYREQADYRPVYAYHRKFLQHLQWRCPGERWVLKAPEHLLHLDTLLETYPDATVVQTHRDPRKVMPSNLDLVINLARDGSLRDDLEALLRDECLHNWSHGADSSWELRQRPEVARRCIDVHFDEIIGDPLGTLVRIYDFAGIELNAAARAQVERFLTSDTDSRHGKHDYSLESLGLDTAEIDRRFAAYLERYNIRGRG